MVIDLEYFPILRYKRYSFSKEGFRESGEENISTILACGDLSIHSHFQNYPD